MLGESCNLGIDEASLFRLGSLTLFAGHGNFDAAKNSKIRFRDSTNAHTHIHTHIEYTTLLMIIAPSTFERGIAPTEIEAQRFFHKARRSDSTAGGLVG